MNYQYIEQLLDRYWNGETTLGEEEILRSFFCQDDVPAHLKAYSEFFTYTRDAKDLCVSDDFDSRFDDILEGEQPAKSEVRLKAIRVTFRQRLMPFIKATVRSSSAISSGTGSAEASSRAAEQAEPAGTPISTRDSKTTNTAGSAMRSLACEWNWI